MFLAWLQTKSQAKGHSLKMALAWFMVWNSQGQAVRLQLLKKFSA
jgi:hypothetical protein